MQHDYVLQKINFDILIPPPGPGDDGRGSAGKIFATTFLHSGFYLICMQQDHVLKKLNFDLLTSRVRRGAAGKICATMLLHL